MSRNQRSHVEFALRVEPAVCLGYILAQQAIGADQRAIREAYRAGIVLASAPDHHEVIADVVETVAVHALFTHVTDRRGPEFLVEHLIAKPLACSNFMRALGKAQKQVTLFCTDVRRSQQLVSLPMECVPQTAGRRNCRSSLRQPPGVG